MDELQATDARYPGHPERVLGLDGKWSTKSTPEQLDWYAERSALAKRMQSIPGCSTCASPETFKPSHFGMSSCQSGSIRSGGRNAHCTCDTCF